MEERQRPNIIEALESPKLFGPAFEGDSWENWKAFLSAMYGLEMTPSRLLTFQEATGRLMPNEKGYLENYAIIGSRGGKSRICSACAVWECLFGGWPDKLSRGETGYAIIVATSKDQGIKIVLSYVKGLLRLFPNTIIRETEDSVFLSNGTAVIVKAANEAGLRGFSSIFIGLDELAYFRDEQAVNPAESIIVSLLPRLKKGGRLLGISTPAAKSGYLYQVFKDFYGQEDNDILVWKKETLAMNPSFHEGLIKRFLHRNKSLYTPEFMAEFLEDAQNFLSEETVMAAQTHLMLLPQPGIHYFAGVDPSGSRSDSMTMAISFRTPESKIIVARAEEVIPPFDPEQTTKYLSEIMKMYGIYEATSDLYAGDWPKAMFAKFGISLKPATKNKSELYLETQVLFHTGKLAIPRGDKILSQFLSLEARVRLGGRTTVDHPAGNFHDDLANAISLAACLASEKTYWTEAEKESRMPILAEPSWRRMFKDPLTRQAETREELERECQKWMGPCGIPDREKKNPWQ